MDTCEEWMKEHKLEEFWNGVHQEEEEREDAGSNNWYESEGD